MQVTNATWQLAGDGSDESLTIQNVGDVRIAFLFAATAPADDAITLDSDEHFILHQGSDALTVTELDTYGKNCYVRALGPKDAALAVEANTAVAET